MEELAFVHILRLVLAATAGAVIGLERELHDKPAGFRTNILICFGAALFTVLSVEMAGEPYSDRTRIAAQIVTGIGFLGAGTILHFKGTVLGLTTAATIWANASVGMAFGAGEYVLGVTGTILTAAVLFGLAYTEEWISSWLETTRFKIKLAPTLESAEIVKKLVDDAGLRVRRWMITKAEEEEGLTLRISVVGPARKIEKVQGALIADERVTSLKRV
jgi:putative Mg2+ transporter-C (MgtC) family protein